MNENRGYGLFRSPYFFHYGRQMLCRCLVFCRSNYNLPICILAVIVSFDRREAFLVELNRRAQRVLHTLAQYLSHGCATEEYHVFGYVLGLVTQCLALAAEPSAV